MWDWIKFSFRVGLAHLTMMIIIVVSILILVGAVDFVTTLPNLLAR